MLDVVSQCIKKLHKIWTLDYLKIEIAEGTFYSLIYENLYTKYNQRQTKGYARKTVPLIVQIYKNCE